MLNEPPTSTDETVGAMLDEMEIGDGRVGLVMFLTRASPGDQGTWGKRGLEIIPMGIAFSPTEEVATYRFTAIHQNTGGRRRARFGALPRFPCGQRWDWR
jgi:hypothetical protein